jgi:hypothetical protein
MGYFAVRAPWRCTPRSYSSPTLATHRRRPLWFRACGVPVQIVPMVSLSETTSTRVYSRRRRPTRARPEKLRRPRTGGEPFPVALLRRSSGDGRRVRVRLPDFVRSGRRPTPQPSAAWVAPTAAPGRGAPSLRGGIAKLVSVRVDARRRRDRRRRRIGRPVAGNPSAETQFGMTYLAGRVRCRPEGRAGGLRMAIRLDHTIAPGEGQDGVGGVLCPHLRPGGQAPAILRKSGPTRHAGCGRHRPVLKVFRRRRSRRLNGERQRRSGPRS